MKGYKFTTIKKDEDVDDAVERAQLRQQNDPDHDKFGVKYQKPEKCS